jgi:hypothetical protein
LEEVKIRGRERGGVIKRAYVYVCDRLCK